MSTIALITGGNRGLGYETARLLGREASVILGARSVATGKEAVAALAADGIDVSYVVIDVINAASVKTAADQIRHEHGRLDILINNAGILPEATEPASHGGPVDLALFKRTFDTNVFGAVAVVEAFLPLLEQSDNGRIVNVSTTMGSLQEQLNPDSPYYGLIVPAYQGSKAALNALTISLAKSLRDTPIKVNAVCPGWLQTDLGGPANRQAAPMSAAQGAEIVAEMATLAAGGASGTFVDREGAVAW